MNKINSLQSTLKSISDLLTFFYVLNGLMGTAILVLSIILVLKVKEVKGRHPEFSEVTMHMVLLILGLLLFGVFSYYWLFYINFKV